MTGRERREQLISIGRTAFAELGVEGASVEEIAARAGVSKPVVYEHFGGKEGLYAVVVDREMLALEKVITDSLENGSWRERIARRLSKAQHAPRKMSSCPGLTRASINGTILPQRDGWPGLRRAEGASAPQAGQARP
ncbi:MAG: TetR/AcrR family transcriptional regulator [Bradyrhizobium sp.]|nr:TetR/AcrR family transcriptional regulator [Bradyrhizobium sp.]